MGGYLGAQCVPEMCVLWKIASGNFYIAKSEKKLYIMEALIICCVLWLYLYSSTNVFENLSENKILSNV